ncbi:unnamed protein product [Cuscuta campestris]|uniref:Uncharacterized protein n=1 Tax=Cuscuta campestris TaxID=132261 RepID=A0A484L192_9ASTE|nr:unnamed protein product [Cuscuta campestris]
MGNNANRVVFIDLTISDSSSDSSSLAFPSLEALTPELSSGPSIASEQSVTSPLPKEENHPHLPQQVSGGVHPNSGVLPNGARTGVSSGCPGTSRPQKRRNPHSGASRLVSGARPSSQGSPSPQQLYGQQSEEWGDYDMGGNRLPFIRREKDGTFPDPPPPSMGPINWPMHLSGETLVKWERIVLMLVPSPSDFLAMENKSQSKVFIDLTLFETSSSSDDNFPTSPAQSNDMAGLSPGEFSRLYPAPRLPTTSPPSPPRLPSGRIDWDCMTLQDFALYQRMRRAKLGRSFLIVEAQPSCESRTASPNLVKSPNDGSSLGAPAPRPGTWEDYDIEEAADSVACPSSKRRSPWRGPHLLLV